MNIREKAIAVAVRTFCSNVVGNEQEVYEALVEFANYNPNAMMSDFEHDGVGAWAYFEDDCAIHFLDNIDGLVADVEKTFN